MSCRLQVCAIQVNYVVFRSTPAINIFISDEQRKNHVMEFFDLIKLEGTNLELFNNWNVSTDIYLIFLLYIINDWNWCVLPCFIWKFLRNCSLDQCLNEEFFFRIVGHISIYVCVNHVNNSQLVQFYIKKYKNLQHWILHV